MRVLLDAHTLIGAGDDSAKVSPPAMSVMQNAANELLIGAGRIWEIAISGGRFFSGVTFDASNRPKPLHANPSVKCLSGEKLASRFECALEPRARSGQRSLNFASSSFFLVGEMLLQAL